MTMGPNSYEIYGIHQAEMMQSIMGRPVRVKAQCNACGRTLVFDFGDGRIGQMNQMDALPFQLCVSDGEICKHQMCGSDYFIRLASAIFTFLHTGIAPIKPQDTLDALAMYSAGAKALASPDEWIPV